MAMQKSLSSEIVAAADGQLTPLLTRPQLAALLNTSVPTLERWAQLGVGPRVTKIGPRQIRYHKDDVRAFLEAGQRPAGIR